MVTSPRFLTDKAKAIARPIREFTVKEYYRLAEVGILQPDENIELLEGQIIEKYTDFQPRLFTVDEYYTMAESGIFQPDERLELLEGIIVEKMVPQGVPHAKFIRRADRLLEKTLGDEFYVHTQLPIHLGKQCEPEPDIFVTRTDILDADDKHPEASDILLVIEVADSTLKSDLTSKKTTYAKAGIIEYWVIDVNNQKLHVFREPVEDDYQNIQALDETQIIVPLAFPNIEIPVIQLLSSPSKK